MSRDLKGQGHKSFRLNISATLRDKWLVMDHLWGTTHPLPIRFFRHFYQISHPMTWIHCARCSVHSALVQVSGYQILDSVHLLMPSDMVIRRWPELYKTDRCCLMQQQHRVSTLEPTQNISLFSMVSLRQFADIQWLNNLSDSDSVHSIHSGRTSCRRNDSVQL